MRARTLLKEMMMDLSSNRFRWMSFICACLVPLVHMTSFNYVSFKPYSGSFILYNFLHHGITSVAVPYFFFPLVFG